MSPFSLFGSKAEKPGFIGIDIGFGGIKLVELKTETGRARLVTYAYANVPAESLEKSLLNDIPGTAELLKKMLAKAKTTSKKAVAALPLSSVFTSIFNIPTTNEKELKDAVVLQAKKLIPLPFEEVAIDTKIIEKIEKTETGKAATRVLVTAAPKTLINKFVELFKATGLELALIETEAFAEIRSLVGKDRATILIVDIGFLRSNIIIVEHGIPVITRSIATGGAGITQTIAKTLGIPLEQAESMKRDIKSMQAFAPEGDLSPILSVLVKPILEEIKYTLELYQTQAASSPGNKHIEKIILTGGSSLLPRLPEFLTKTVGINTYLGNPWARVVYPVELKPVLEELGPRFAVPIGCAMQNIDS